MELLSEEEQWEKLKHWLRTNVPAVLIMVALLLVAWFGWKWWQDRADKDALAASATYEKILNTFDENKPTEALALIEVLRSEHPKSPYVGAADLMSVRAFVATNQLDKAIERLQRVATTAVDEKLRPIAQLRLARVEAAQGQYDKALATLGTKDLGVHEAARLEIRGDLLFAKGDHAGALKEYESARAKLAPGGDTGVAELLDLKIADLKSGTPAAAAAAPAPATTETPAK
ncbi:MAG: tetratricopeptide repeat protein [Steroidobacteraceae bacterium]